MAFNFAFRFNTDSSFVVTMNEIVSVNEFAHRVRKSNENEIGSMG